jgi:hypothetical protein
MYKGVGYSPQSRQSAKRFSSRWNWDSPTPLAAGSVHTPSTLHATHPLVGGGGEGTLAGG